MTPHSVPHTHLKDLTNVQAFAKGEGTAGFHVKEIKILIVEKRIVGMRLVIYLVCDDLLHRVRFLVQVQDNLTTSGKRIKEAFSRNTLESTQTTISFSSLSFSLYLDPDLLRSQSGNE
ncbi:hypothetical protein QVD17_21003 [Tagetes erecta]|uniref:Uncharacterized protein n=1 Tax=Tagetes erecta TaxID=13708 RepID=A0AAD8KQ69_TARER|nr:hypothetical protein QVD17_21003 [Tagetes erecta]